MARPTKGQIQAEAQAILRIVRSDTAGLKLDEIASAYREATGSEIADRTLQRRLKLLVKRGELEISGRARATVYRTARATSTQPATPETGNGYPPLTTHAAEVRALVRRPISLRSPVGYVRDWLFEYEAGETWYLTTAQRTHLHEVGRTPDADRPAGTFARDILGRLLIDLAWASSRLEGNTYSRLDTVNLIEFGQRAEGKDAVEAQMILNHKAAIEFLVSGSDLLGVNRHTLLGLHALLSENLLGDPADEGRLRERPVGITGSAYTPVAVPQVVSECFDRIVETASRIPDPFEQAFFAMVHIPYLQPFADVNKRTSRLAANIPFVMGNLCPLSFVDVPQQAYTDGILAVYELRRIELLRDVFVFAYERSAATYRVIRESLGVPDPIRLRYRTQLADVVQQVVLSNEAPNEKRLRDLGRGLGVPETDVDAFGKAALQITLGLHEGSAARYGLTPGQFQSWRSAFTQHRR